MCRQIFLFSLVQSSYCKILLCLSHVVKCTFSFHILSTVCGDNIFLFLDKLIFILFQNRSHYPPHTIDPYPTPDNNGAYYTLVPPSSHVAVGSPTTTSSTTNSFPPPPTYDESLRSPAVPSAPPLHEQKRRCLIC